MFSLFRLQATKSIRNIKATQLTSINFRQMCAQLPSSQEMDQLLVNLREKTMNLDEITEVIKSNKLLVPQHYNLLMSKTSRIYEDLLLKAKREATHSKDNKDDFASGEIPSYAINIFRSSLDKVVEGAKDLSKTDLTTCLSIVGKSKVNYIPEPVLLSTLEDRILEDIGEYQIIDQISLVPYFVKRGYVPKKLLAKIDEDESFITVSSTMIRDLLNSMIKAKYTDHPNIYIKVFKQMKMSSTNMDVNDICTVFQKFKDIDSLGIFDEHPELKQTFGQEFIEYFIKKIVELERNGNEPNNANLETLLKNISILNIDHNNLNSSLVAFLKSKINSHLKFVVSCIELLPESAVFSLVNNLISAFKQKEVDVRDLSLNELGTLMIAILQHQNYEIMPFLRYINHLLPKEYQDEFEINKTSQLFYNLVKYGYVNTEERDNIYYHFVNDLCINYDDLEEDNYINTIWALACTEETDLQNPLIPILIEKLPNFKTKPQMNEEELAQFYQLIMFVYQKIEDSLYPAEYRIPVG